MSPLPSILLRVLALQAATALAFKLPIKNLVTFCDSYTDVVNIALINGTPWPVYAADYGHLSLFPFARSGATCSNHLTPRVFPSVLEDELPTYLNATAHGTSLRPAETLYTLWIGTNDVGVGELLTGQSTPGVNIVNTSACVVSWVKELYDTGARNFLVQNMVPLDHVPLYSPDSYTNRYWTAQRNTTEWSVFMGELVAAGNSLTELMLSALAPKLHGANIGVFDSHGLFTDIINHPALYLNGTAPLNVTGSTHACVFQLNEPTSDPGVCTDASGSDRDSFVWFDELHPSEQSHRIVARELISAVNGSSERWVTWFS